MRRFTTNTYANVYNLLIGAGLVIIMLFAMMSVGTYINGSVGQNFIENVDTTTDLGHAANTTFINLSNDYDDVLDSLTVAALVMAITLPLAAVVAIKKFF